MPRRILLQSLFLFLLTICLTLALQGPDSTPDAKHNEEKFEEIYQEVARIKRATNKPGFFRTLFSVIFEQWNDTRNTFGGINQMINDNFAPDNEPITQAPPPSNDTNRTTTEAPYRITRAELYKILQRNLRGIRNLYNVELEDALKNSKIYKAEFRKNASREVSKFL